MSHLWLEETEIIAIAGGCWEKNSRAYSKNYKIICNQNKNGNEKYIKQRRHKWTQTMTYKQQYHI